MAVLSVYSGEASISRGIVLLTVKLFMRDFCLIRVSPKPLLFSSISFFFFTSRFIFKNISIEGKNG